MSRPSPPPSALGIDFGTSNTIAVVRRADGALRPLLFDGTPLMPSAVLAETGGGLIVGRDAIHSGRRFPERYEPNPKRLIDRTTTLLGDREFQVADLIAAVLAAVAVECRRVVGPPREVTITVPAGWGPARRRAVTEAAAKAGLSPVRIVPEPVAAATYFAETLRRNIPIGQSLVVYDLGAGTFDAGVVRRTAHGFETVALDGRADLGGIDIDAALVSCLAETYGAHPAWARLTGPSTAEERRHLGRFHEEIRAAKERLSRHQQADLAIPLLEVDAHLTRAELDRVAAPLLDQTVQVTRGVISSAGIDPARCAGIFLVGGASRMPLVATVIHRALGVAPTVLDQPEVVVAEGSVLWAEPTPPATGPAAPRTAAYRPPAPVTPPAPPPAPAPTTRQRERRQRRTARIVLAVLLVDVLIVALLVALG